jgi:hypothetical protein
MLNLNVGIFAPFPGIFDAENGDASGRARRPESCRGIAATSDGDMYIM